MGEPIFENKTMNCPIYGFYVRVNEENVRMIYVMYETIFMHLEYIVDQHVYGCQLTCYLKGPVQMVRSSWIENLVQNDNNYTDFNRLSI